MSGSSTAATTSANLCRTLRAATPLLFLGRTNVTNYYGRGCARLPPGLAIPRLPVLMAKPAEWRRCRARSLRSLTTNSRGMAVGAAAPTNYPNSLTLTNSINPNMFIDSHIRVPRSPGLPRFIPQPDRYAERYGHFVDVSRSG